jgi:hypothetical protein
MSCCEHPRSSLIRHQRLAALVMQRRCCWKQIDEVRCAAAAAAFCVRAACLILDAWRTHAAGKAGRHRHTAARHHSTGARLSSPRAALRVCSSRRGARLRAFAALPHDHHPPSPTSRFRHVRKRPHVRLASSTRALHRPRAVVAPAAAPSRALVFAGTAGARVRGPTRRAPSAPCTAGTVAMAACAAADARRWHGSC